MATVLTIRDVPDDVKDALAQQARERGQSVQAFVLALLARQAAFSRNRRLLTEIEHDLAGGGGVAGDAPNAADVLADARAEREPGGSEPPASRADGAA